MSYCRFGGNCDVYVYEGEDGVNIHVATKRPETAVSYPKTDTTMSGQDMLDLHKKYIIEFTSIPKVQIGLPYDGQSFYGLEYECAAFKLLMLKGLGYRVPQIVIDALLEESEDD